MTINLSYKNNLLVGVISDTHGYVTPAVCKAFEQTDLIVHAGDIGRPDVIKTLKRISTLVAVRGNMDFGMWADRLPRTQQIQIGHFSIYVIHDMQRLDLEPGPAGITAVISGHTHRPAAQEKNGVLFLNPGSASHPKFGDSSSVALLRLQANGLTPRFVNLDNYTTP
jgi:putative phosphoesterase